MTACPCGDFKHELAARDPWFEVLLAIQPKPSPAALVTLIMLALRLDPVTGCGRVKRGTATRDAGLADPKVASEAAGWAIKHGLLIQLERGGNRLNGGPVVSAWALAIPPGQPTRGASDPIVGQRGERAGQPTRGASDPIVGDDISPGRATRGASGPVVDDPGTENDISPGRATRGERQSGSARVAASVSPGQPTRGASDPIVAQDAKAQVAPQEGNAKAAKTQSPRSAHKRGTSPTYVQTGVKDKDQPGVADAPPGGDTLWDDDTAGLSETQRSKRLTDRYAEVVGPQMVLWPAVNAVVLRCIRSGQYTDDQIDVALARHVKDNRTPTVNTMRIELEGPPARRQHQAREEPVYHEGPEYWRQ